MQIGVIFIIFVQGFVEEAGGEEAVPGWTGGEEEAVRGAPEDRECFGQEVISRDDLIEVGFKVNSFLDVVLCRKSICVGVLVSL